MTLTTIKIDASDCYWRNLFTSEQLDEIEQYCNKFDTESGTIDNSNRSDSNMRQSNIAWIERNSECEWFFSAIEKAVNKINTRFFGFDIFRLNIMQYTLYDEAGSHYDWHWDMYYAVPLEGDSPQQRKVSVVLQLSDPSEYDGGELELSPGGSIKTVPKERGYMSIFPGFVVHRVSPVTLGKRKTLVAWFTGPDWR